MSSSNPSPHTMSILLTDAKKQIRRKAILTGEFRHFKGPMILTADSGSIEHIKYRIKRRHKWKTILLTEMPKSK
jgi:hypothetical protein